MTVTSAVGVIATPPMVAETVFTSTSVDESDPAACPAASVTAPGCVRVLPEPVAESTTASPGMTLLFPSRAVTVMVLVGPLAAMLVGEATIVEFVAETAPGFTTTAGCVVIGVAPMVTTTVLLWATVDVNEPVITPDAFVVPAGCTSVFPVPLTVKLAERPAIAIPNWFRAVIVTVLEVPSALMGPEAVAEDWLAETAPAATVTAAVCVIAVPLIVADTVFGSATVDAMVPVVTPLPFVAAGWPSVFPVPLEASTTVAPLIRLLNASRAVTVIVLAGPPASIELGEAVTVDVAAETAAGFTTTDGCTERIVAPPIVTTTVFGSATVDVKEPVITPEALVVPTGCAGVFPVPLTVKVAAKPEIGLPFTSRVVMVTVLAAPPAVIGPEAVTSELVAESAPGFTTTTGCVVIGVLPMVTTTVLLCATVDVKEPVMTPEAFVVPTGCVSEFPVPLTVKLAVRPGIRLLKASRAVIVTVLAAPPAVIGVLAVAEEVAAETAPGFTVTAAVCVIGVPLIVADTVLASATVDAMVPVVTPLPFVAAGWPMVLVLPVDASTTVAPLIRLLKASRAVTVTVLAAPPAVMVLGDAVTVDVAAETAPGFTTTTGCVVITVAPIVTTTVFDSAVVDVNEPVVTPDALVALAGCTGVFPVPLTVKLAVRPEIGMPNWFRAVIVTVLAAPPAVIGVDAVAVD